MKNTGKLSGKTVFITGGSRGIGKEIAVKVAKDGANVVIAAKTAKPNPKLPGTIYTAVKEVEEAGGKGLACIVDIRDEAQIKAAIDETVKQFGGIDILVNNASAISLTGTEDTEMKRYDLMHNINTRGTFLTSKLCLPYLKKSSHAHILNISPPLNLKPYWFSSHVAYTMAKYGMSMCVLGMHEELNPYNIAVNALWPRSAINTAAFAMLAGKEASNNYSRKPQIMADAAYWILTQDPKPTGQFFIDDEIILHAGITDLDRYACNPAYKDDIHMDFYVDDAGSLTKQEIFEHSEIGKVEHIFKVIEKGLNPSIVKETQGVYQFILTGKEAGAWFVNLKTGSGSCGKRYVPQKPDVTLILDSNDFIEIFLGKLNPNSAFNEGKMRINGNVQKIPTLLALISSLKSKL